MCIRSDIACSLLGAPILASYCMQIYHHFDASFRNPTFPNHRRSPHSSSHFNNLISPGVRLGLQGDTRDARTASFLHVLDVLPRLRRPPRYLLLENVRGFERSAARDALIATLRRLGLHWRELLLSPVQLGVPNSRTRYYLLARRRPFPFATPPEGQVSHGPEGQGRLRGRILDFGSRGPRPNQYIYFLILHFNFNTTPI